jgi:DNA-3-methyladenine glycosylase II
LDAARLRAQPPDEALDGLQQLPGVGPFGAELILVRGAGAVDVFPRHEKRLHAEMARRYGLPDEPSIEELADVAEAWRPYRSWAAFHLRVAAESG